MQPLEAEPLHATGARGWSPARKLSEIPTPANQAPGNSRRNKR